MLVRNFIHVLLISSQVSTFHTNGMVRHGLYPVNVRQSLLQVGPTNDDSSKAAEGKMDRTNQDPLTIKFYGTVTTESCMTLTNMIETLDIKSKEAELKYGFRIPIKLHIQSVGGELMPAFYVCDMMKRLDTPVHVYVDGYVASAASLIAVCGHKRYDETFFHINSSVDIQHIRKICGIERRNEQP